MEKKNELTITKNISDSVLTRVQAFENKGELVLPEDYSAENALKSAYLMLQDVQTRDKKPVLTACDKTSIANCLLDMVVQGLNPAKKQCYFIAYNNKLTLMRSYFGTIAVAKSFGEIEDVTAQVILEGDDFEFEIVRGKKIVTKHKQTFASMNKNIICGAYATIIYKDGREESCIMTMNEIQKSWNQSKSADQKVHKQFPDEMAKRTVINKLLKLYINSKKDTNLVLKKSIENSDDERAENEILEEINKNQNKHEMDIIDADYSDIETTAEIVVDEETGEILEETVVNEQPQNDEDPF